MVNVLSFYSNIAILLNIYPIEHRFNTAMYLANWQCFLGNLFLMFYDPYHIVKLTRTIAFVNQLPLVVLHFLNQLYHIAPLYLFRKRQTWSETISAKSFLLSIIFFMSYSLLVSDNLIVNAYGITKTHFVFLFGSMVSVAWLCTFLSKKK